LSTAFRKILPQNLYKTSTLREYFYYQSKMEPCTTHLFALPDSFQTIEKTLREIPIGMNYWELSGNLLPAVPY